MANENYVQRTKLLDQIESLPRVLLLNAPAGFGKTVFVDQIVQRFKVASVIQTMTVWQRDVTALNEMCIQAFAPYVPHLTTASLNAEQSVIELAGQIDSVLETPLFYILDDIHHLKNFRRAEEWVQAWVNYAPDRVHLILAGRRMLSLSWAELVANNQIQSFGIDDLAFTVEEVAEMHSEMEPEEAQVHVERFGGWVTGIKLARSAATEYSGDSTSILTKPQEAFNELVAPQFENFSGDRQKFLMYSATTQVFDAAICELLGAGNMNFHLSYFVENNFFVHQAQGGWRYNPLLRDFLQARLRESNFELYTRLHRKMAHWLQERELTTEAVYHFLQAGDTDQAVSLAEMVTQDYFIRGRYEALLRFEALLHESPAPRLRLFCGMVLSNLMRYVDSNKMLLSAKQVYFERGENKRILWVTLQQAFNAYYMHQYHQAIAVAHTIIEKTTDNEIIAWAKRITGLSQLELGNFDDSCEQLQFALAYFKDHPQQYTQAQVLQDLSEVYFRSGDMEQAVESLAKVIALKRELGNKDELALALNNLGHYLHRNFQYDDSLSAIEEGLDLVGSHNRMAGYLYWTRGDLNRDLGLFDAAEQDYQLARDFIDGQDRYLYVSVRLSLAHLRCWQGCWQEAVSVLENVVAWDEDSVQQISAQALYALLQWRLEGHADHKSCLQQAIRKLQNRKSYLELALLVGLYLSVGLHYDDTEVLEHVGELVDMINPTLYQPISVAVLHLEALPDYVHQHLPRLHEVIEMLPAPYHAQQGLPLGLEQSYRLEFTLLGRDQVKCNNKLVTTWTSALSREIFLYLYFYGPKTKEEIGIEFWPERSAETIRSNLHTYRKRADHALQSEAIVYQDGLYQVNPAYRIRSDAKDFEDAIVRARQLLALDAHTEFLYQKALSLYQGYFIPESKAAWVEYQREYFQDLYIEALLGAGECAEARKDYSLALKFYEQALQQEPYSEANCRHVMRCHSYLGRKDQVKFTYDDFAQQLQDDLGIDPSRQTQAYLHKLLSK